VGGGGWGGIEFLGPTAWLLEKGEGEWKGHRFGVIREKGMLAKKISREKEESKEGPTRQY